MKYILKPLLLILIVAAMVGCSKSNNSSPITAKVTIVGKWYFSTDTVNNVSNGKITKSFINEGFTTSDYYQFNTDGTGTTGGPSLGVQAFTYNINGSIVTMNTPASTVNGFPEPAYTETATIKAATSTDLFLYYDDADPDGVAGDRVTEAQHLKK